MGRGNDPSRKAPPMFSALFILLDRIQADRKAGIVRPPYYPVIICKGCKSPNYDCKCPPIKF